MGCWTPPFGNPQVLAGAVNLTELLAASRLELRCRWGRPRAPTRSPRLPHLHRFDLGACAPLPPKVPRWGTSARHARLRADAPWPPAFPKGKSPPIMRASAWDRVRNGFAGNAPANLPEAPAAQRLGVPSLSSRGCAEGTLARPQGGIPKGAQPSLASLCLLSAGAESRGPRAARARRRDQLKF